MSHFLRILYKRKIKIKFIFLLLFTLGSFPRKEDFLAWKAEEAGATQSIRGCVLWRRGSGLSKVAGLGYQGASGAQQTRRPIFFFCWTRMGG